jgi:protease I
VRGAARVPVPSGLSVPVSKGLRMARIAIPLANGFEDAEFVVPRAWLLEAGHEIVVIGRQAGETVDGKLERVRARVASASADVDAEDFDALLLAGGSEHDRADPHTVEFVRRFAASGRAIAAICHGAQLLAEAGAVAGRTLTSWPSARADLERAGAQWVDRAVVVDGNLVTARRLADLEDFCRAFLEVLDA